MDFYDDTLYSDGFVEEFIDSEYILTEDDDVDDEILEIIDEVEDVDDSYDEAGESEEDEDDYVPDPDDDSEEDEDTEYVIPYDEDDDESGYYEEDIYYEDDRGSGDLIVPDNPWYIPTTDEDEEIDEDGNVTKLSEEVDLPSTEHDTEISDKAVYTAEDKNHLDYLYSVFSGLSEEKLRQEVSEYEKVGTKDADIDLSTDEKKNDFLTCIDSLYISEEDADEIDSNATKAVNDAFSVSDDVVAFLMPINPNAIKRGFSGAFDEELTDEQIQDINNALDTAVATITRFDEDSVDNVVERFRDLATNLDDEQKDICEKVIRDSVYDAQDNKTARVQHVKECLLNEGIDSRDISSAEPTIVDVVNRLYDAKTKEDISNDIFEALQDDHSDIAAEVQAKFNEFDNLFITTDDLDSLRSGMAEKLEGYDQEVLDLVDAVILNNITSDEDPFSLEYGKLSIVGAVIDSLNSRTLTQDEVELTKIVAKEIIGDHISANTIEAKLGRFENIVSRTISTEQLYAAKATIREATIENLYVTNLYAKFAVIEKAIIDELDARLANIDVANIDFANIDLAQVEKIFAESGIIKDLVTEHGSITGELVGVTIKGDLIEGNTIKADKIVVLGSDGLYYKLNLNGETVEAQQTDYNSINGSHIQAKTITASKVNVTDLVAFGATIGGLVLENGSIHSTGKTLDNNASGLYFDSQGQLNAGDVTNFIKSWYDETDQKWKVKIQSDLITFSNGQSVSQAISDAATVNHYGTSSTAIDTADKVVDLSGFTLYTGAQITVKFTNGNSAAAPTLNVNGTGAKPVIVNGATTALTGKMDFPAGTTCSFTYDGSHWQLTGTDNTHNVMDWTDSSGLTVRAKSGSQSRVNVNSGAVDIYDKNGKLGSKVNENGLTTYKAGSKRAEFFDEIKFYDKDGSTEVAKLGATSRIGKLSGTRMYFNDSTIDFANSSNSKLLSIGTSAENKGEIEFSKGAYKGSYSRINGLVDTNGVSDINMFVRTSMNASMPGAVHLFASNADASKGGDIYTSPLEVRISQTDDNTKKDAEIVVQDGHVYISVGTISSPKYYRFNNDSASFPGDLTLNGHGSSIGTDIPYTYNYGSVTKVSDPKSLCYIDLPIGTWLVRGYVTFAGATGANGHRRASISDTKDNMVLQSFGVDAKYVEGNYIIVCSPYRIIGVSSKTRYYLNASAADTVDISARNLRAIRLL